MDALRRLEVFVRLNGRLTRLPILITVLEVFRRDFEHEGVEREEGVETVVPAEGRARRKDNELIPLENSLTESTQRQPKVQRYVGEFLRDLLLDHNQRVQRRLDDALEIASEDELSPVLAGEEPACLKHITYMAACTAW